MDAALVQKPGLFSTIQDLGRPGYKQYGVAQSGSLDTYSHHRANYLLGNPPSAAVLEITLRGPQLLFLNYTTVALTGANLSPKLNGIPVNTQEAIYVAKGDVLSFGERQSGCRAYLAISGGFLTEETLGSRSTHVRSGWGGLDGGALREGQILASFLKPRTLPRKLPAFTFDVFDSTIRITKGPEADDVDWHCLERSSWTVLSASDRSGIRLSGPEIYVPAQEIISSPVDVGTIQLPRSGQPIVLLQDGASVGGYPRVASVVQTDLPKLVQRAPNEPIVFEQISMKEARDLHGEYLQLLRKLASSSEHLP